jgi:hypothetical protein
MNQWGPLTTVTHTTLLGGPQKLVSHMHTTARTPHLAQALSWRNGIWSLHSLHLEGIAIGRMPIPAIPASSVATKPTKVALLLPALRAV